MSNVVQLRTTATKAEAGSDAVWLSPEQVCERVPGMTVRILRSRRAEGLKPDYQKPSRKIVVYSAADIDAWVEASRVRGRDVG